MKCQSCDVELGKTITETDRIVKLSCGPWMHCVCNLDISSKPCNSVFILKTSKRVWQLFWIIFLTIKAAFLPFLVSLSTTFLCWQCYHSDTSESSMAVAAVGPPKISASQSPLEPAFHFYTSIIQSALSSPRSHLRNHWGPAKSTPEPVQGLPSGKPSEEFYMVQALNQM